MYINDFIYLFLMITILLYFIHVQGTHSNNQSQQPNLPNPITMWLDSAVPAHKNQPQVSLVTGMKEALEKNLVSHQFGCFEIFLEVSVLFGSQK